MKWTVPFPIQGLKKGIVTTTDSAGPLKITEEVK